MKKPELAGQRGYTGKEKETAKGYKAPDLKEFWQIGQIIADDISLDNNYLQNIQIDELPSFNLVTEEVFKKLEAAGKTLIKGDSGLP